MSSTFFSAELADNTLFARLHCEKIAERESSVLQTELALIGESHRGRMALDMTEVTILASVGLGALVTINKRCKTAGGKLVIYGLNEDLHELLKISRFDRILTIVADKAAATKAFS